MYCNNPFCITPYEDPEPTNNLLYEHSAEAEK
jgi:hypothetical protein